VVISHKDNKETQRILLFQLLMTTVQQTAFRPKLINLSRYILCVSLLSLWETPTPVSLKDPLIPPALPPKRVPGDIFFHLVSSLPGFVVPILTDYAIAYE